MSEPTCWCESDDGRQEVVDLIHSGCTVFEAIDYLMTRRTSMTQTEWAEYRRITPRAVSNSVRRAASKLEAYDEG